MKYKRGDTVTYKDITTTKVKIVECLIQNNLSVDVYMILFNGKHYVVEGKDLSTTVLQRVMNFVERFNVFR